jgi:hypothetical protein
MSLGEKVSIGTVVREWVVPVEINTLHDFLASGAFAVAFKDTIKARLALVGGVRLAFEPYVNLSQRPDGIRLLLGPSKIAKDGKRAALLLMPAGLATRIVQVNRIEEQRGCFLAAIIVGLLLCILPGLAAWAAYRFLGRFAHRNHVVLADVLVETVTKQYGSSRAH